MKNILMFISITVFIMYSAVNAADQEYQLTPHGSTSSRESSHDAHKFDDEIIDYQSMPRPQTIDEAANQVRELQSRGSNNQDIARHVSRIVDQRMDNANAGEGLIRRGFLATATEEPEKRLSFLDYSGVDTHDRFIRESDNLPGDKYADYIPRAEWAWNNRYGQCEEAMSISRVILEEAGVQNVKSLRSNDHAYVVIGMSENAEIGDPRTWGPNAYVVDGWQGIELNSEEAYDNPYVGANGTKTPQDQTSSYGFREHYERWLRDRNLAQQNQHPSATEPDKQEMEGTTGTIEDETSPATGRDNPPTGTAGTGTSSQEESQQTDTSETDDSATDREQEEKPPEDSEASEETTTSTGFGDSESPAETTTSELFGDSEAPAETTTAAAFGDSEAAPEYSSTPEESGVPDQPSIDYQAVSDAAAQYQQTTTPGAQIVVPVEAPWQQQDQQFLQQQALEQSYQQLQQIQQQMQMNSQWMYQTWSAQPQFQPRPPGPQQPVSSLPPSRSTRPDKPTVRSHTHQEQAFPPPKPGKPNPFNKPPRVDKPNPFNKPPQTNRPPSRTAVQPAPPASPPPRPAPQNCRQVCAQWRTYIVNITDNRTGLCGGKAGRAWSGEIWVICVEKKECVRWETRCY